jgi:hypothetical protein
VEEPLFLLNNADADIIGADPNQPLLFKAATVLSGLNRGNQVILGPAYMDENHRVYLEKFDFTVTRADLTIEIDSLSIVEGEPTPTGFTITSEGLAYDDEIPNTAQLVYYAEGSTTSPVDITGPLPAGVYDVYLDLTGIESGLDPDNYNISQPAPGKLYVNAEVGCNERITISDICKTDLGGGQVQLCFTYDNPTDFTYYIPFGSGDNQFKTKGRIAVVGGDEPPSVFGPGIGQTLCIITNGDAVQWEVVTPGCNSASKSATGSNANPCDSSVALTSNVELDSFTSDLEQNAPEAYPNPTTDYLTLFVGNMQESVQVTVFDEVGRQLMARNYPIEDGQSEVYLDISALKEGILTIVTESQGDRTAFRIIKQ